jgi:hypothetical protein
MHIQPLSCLKIRLAITRTGLDELASGGTLAWLTQDDLDDPESIYEGIARVELSVSGVDEFIEPGAE